jgi:hypothetical protein
MYARGAGGKHVVECLRVEANLPFGRAGDADPCKQPRARQVPAA